MTLGAATGLVIDDFTLPYPHPFPATEENPFTGFGSATWTCFGPREISKQDGNTGFTSPCSAGFGALAPHPGRKNGPARVSEGMEDKQSRVVSPRRPSWISGELVNPGHVSSAKGRISQMTH